MKNNLPDQIVKGIGTALKSSVGDRSTTVRYSFLLVQAEAVVQLLGSAGRPLKEMLDSFDTDGTYGGYDCDSIEGWLEGTKHAVECGLLRTAESVILAEAYGDLLEQAKELLDKGYFLAAGVLGRAVLESHLRKWCEHEQCLPTKDKPMLGDFKTALRAKQLITKTVQAHIEAMAAVGNDAAHAKPELKQHEVERLLNDLTAFLATHPLP